MCLDHCQKKWLPPYSRKKKRKKKKEKKKGVFRQWNLKGYWKKQAEIPESIKEEANFLGVIKKKSSGFSIGLRFLVLEFPWGVAQICGISRGEAFFLRIKWQIYKFQGFFLEMYIYHQPTPSLEFF